jgi:hypothetical protein
MGRLPDQWAGKRITMRVPYEMDGELTLTSGQSGVQFPDATFMNNVDKPFEIHRLIPRITAVDENDAPLATQPSQDLLAELVRVLITDIGKNSPMTKSPTLINLLTKGSSERTWEWADPYYLIRSESIQIVCDALVYPTIQGLAALRIEFAFQGYLVVVAPPSEAR